LALFLSLLYSFCPFNFNFNFLSFFLFLSHFTFFLYLLFIFFPKWHWLTPPPPPYHKMPILQTLFELCCAFSLVDPFIVKNLWTLKTWKTVALWSKLFKYIVSDYCAAFLK
jgi:hypothetical protein